MTRNPLLIVALIAALIGIGWFFGRDALFPSEPAETPTAFSAEGNLIQDGEGWALSHEAPGAPGLLAPLIFDAGSTCTGEGLASPCNPTQFTAGMRVSIMGIQTGRHVQVTSLTLMAPPPEDGLPVKLYFYNPANDQGVGGAQCTEKGLVAVERVIPRTDAALQDAIRILLRGELSDTERAAGITTEFPLEGVSLKSSELTDGVLTLTFDDPQNKTGGGSCRVAILWKQIEATAKQFPGVQSVRFMPEELFQP